MWEFRFKGCDASPAWWLLSEIRLEGYCLCGFRFERSPVMPHPLGDFCLCELRIGLLGLLARIHTEEVEGGLVRLGGMGVL